MTIDLNSCNKIACIVADKIFARCKTKECISNVEIPLKVEELKEIRFKQGFIIDETLEIYDIKDRSNFKRVIFQMNIPFQVKTYDGKVYNGFTPNIKQDIVLFMPDCKRSEFNFKVELETSSQVLGDVIESGNKSHFAAGIYTIISVVGRVQLLIPYFGFCPEPPICLDFEFEDDICEKFHDEPFPDFYPPQLPKRKKICIRKDIKVRKVNDVIIYGQIKKCATEEFIEGAIIKAFYTDETGNLKSICHTYSGCNGYYMLRIPPQFEGEIITIMASKYSCMDELKPCECRK